VRSAPVFAAVRERIVMKDRIVDIVVTLASEVWSLRERIAALEAIGIRQGSLSGGELDAYEFSPDEATRFAGERRDFMENLFSALQGQAPSKASRRPRAAAGRRKPQAARSRRRSR
jgi:hypothetical protein